MTALSLLFGLGVAIGLGWAALAAPRSRSVELVDQAMIVLLGALAGGRSGYVWVHAVYYAAHPGEVFQVWQGGLMAEGALAGGLIFLFALGWLSKISPSRLADDLFPLAVTLSVTAWIGAWWMAASPGAERPIYLAGALFSTAWAASLDFARGSGRFLSRAAPGALAALWLLGAAACLLGAAFLNPPAALTWHGLFLEVWINLALAVFGGAWLLASRRQPGRA